MTLKENKYQQKRKLSGPLRTKGVSGEPHPLDRQSGNGNIKKMRKGGQGIGNWGTYKDELNEYYENDNIERKLSQEYSSWKQKYI